MGLFPDSELVKEIGPLWAATGNRASAAVYADFAPGLAAAQSERDLPHSVANGRPAQALAYAETHRTLGNRAAVQAGGEQRAKDALAELQSEA